jgi:hypothetical protein
VADREDRVTDVAGEIETMLQKWESKQFAQIILRATDPQSLDHPLREGQYKHSRRLLTAAVFKLADTIVNGVKHD